MSIPRGVTPTFTLTFSDPSIDFTIAQHVYVTFKGVDTITKQDDELTIREKEIDIYLTQAETLRFVNGMVQIQVNWTYQNGRRAASDIKKYSFSPQLLDKVVD